eukprot:TRINITY_DN39325_c0_g1_i1.p1 TRINITY_DN39325_c0_g1~~TRINITY_DN39325_c0_g1_i1.p1  ORF type:complete len:207 (-),score=30.05 TRINITY_DN39325_c0_g1_i1:80-700(-)
MIASCARGALRTLPRAGLVGVSVTLFPTWPSRCQYATKPSVSSLGTASSPVFMEKLSRYGRDELAGRALTLAKKRELEDVEMLELNELLLSVVAQLDYGTYTELCDDWLSCFEPEAQGHLVLGLPFHRYYFDFFAAQPGGPKPQTTVGAPHIRWLADRQAAVVCFKRILQKGTVTVCTEETRVWEFSGSENDRRWRLVHFHRTAPK